MDNKKKIAFVIQRYGKEVNGGSETYCRQLATRMKDSYDIEILTTCALDYVTWDNRYKAGIEEENGIIIRRFKVNKPRLQNYFNKISNKIFCNNNHNIKDEIIWMETQGPYCPELIDYIRENKSKYDVFIFMTYLYYSTYFGIQQVPEKSVLISTAHDEPPIYLDIFYPLFHLPRAIIFLTDEEKKFVNNKFNNDYIYSEVIGIDINIPKSIQPESFRTKYGIIDDFIVYVGRIDVSKGCEELFRYFIKYKEQLNSKLKLVLIGKTVMDIPKHPDILHLGFLSDEDKNNAISASKLLVLPSYYESLSLSVLESLALGNPVLVNKKCEVLKGHCIKSNAGLYYENYDEFKECLSLLLGNKELLVVMGQKGIKYINNNYSYDIFHNKLSNLLNKISF